MLRRIVLAALGTGVVLGADAARADVWPIVRRDASRTAASKGTLFSGAPVKVWRAYLGGRPDFGVAAFRQGATSLIIATGGRVVQRDLLTQAVAWESEPLGDPTVVDIGDLDGNGKLEVVVRTSPFVVVLDYATGKTQWKSSATTFKYVATPRMRDLDGDGLADLYIDECTGCAKVGAMSAGAYSFKNGFGAPIVLWERLASQGPSPTNSGTDSLVDLAADGAPEVALGSPDQMLIVDGATGNQIASLKHPSSKLFFAEAGAIAANLDGLPGNELVVVQPQGLSGFSGPPGFAAFRVDPKTGSWSTLWASAPGAFDAEVVDGADVVSDLDGDGASEIVLSFRANAASTSWTTRVLDGATGSVRAELAGARFEGAADLDGKPGAELVVVSPGGLRAWRLGPSGVVSASDALPGVRAVRWVDVDKYRSGPQYRTLVVLRRPGQPAQLLVGEPTGASAAAGLPRATTFAKARPISLASGAWVIGPTYQPLVGEITGAFPGGFTTRPYEQVALGTSAGTVDVLDASMQTTNGLVSVFGQAIGTIVGGNEAGKLGHNLIGADASGPFVVIPYTPVGTLVGNAGLAAWLLPPWPRWLQTGSTSPAIVNLGALGEAVVGVEGTTLVARGSASGKKLGALDLGPGSPIGSPMPIRRANADALVGIDWRIAGNQAVQHAVDFSTQTEPWTANPVSYGGFWGSTVADLDGDGADEWYSMYGSLFRRDISSGVVTKFPVSTTYSLPIAASFSGASSELLLQSGYGGPILAKSDLTAAWVGEPPEPMNAMHGTRTECSGGALFVTPAVTSPWLRAYSGKSGAIVAKKVLAGGSVFDTLALAEAAGKRQGYLTHASSVAKAGAGPAVFVGSTDGYLYAVDGCSLDLLWSVDLGAPVGEATVGDYDADGSEEIMVGTSRGLVYGIDHPKLPAPVAVMLNGGTEPGGVVIEPGQAVHASWTPVAGAASYEVGLMSPDEQAIWTPAYTKVDSPAFVLELKDGLAGRPYRLSVRASGSDGQSAEVASAPIVIADVVPPKASVSCKAPVAGGLTLELALSDDLALDHYLLWWRAGAAGERSLLGDGMAKGKAAQPVVDWVVPTSTWGGAIEIVVEAVDSAGNRAESSLEIQVTPDGKVILPTGAGPSAPEPPDPRTPQQAGPAANGGCGVASSETTVDWMILALAATALVRRKRRTRVS